MAEEGDQPVYINFVFIVSIKSVIKFWLKVNTNIFLRAFRGY
jgi:hypothetical protein